MHTASDVNCISYPWVPKYSRRLFQPDPSYSCAISLPHQYLSCLHHAFWHNLMLPHWDWRKSEGSCRAIPLTAGFSPSCVTQLVPDPYPTSVEQAAWQPPMGLSCLSTYIHARWWVESTQLEISGLQYLRGFFKLYETAKWMRWEGRGWMTYTWVV